MWTVVHIAATKAAADRVVEMLREQGILATIKRSMPGEQDGSYEIQVLECEALDAQEALRSLRAGIAARR